MIMPIRQLKPCPFCASSRVKMEFDKDRDEWWFVGCTRCCAIGPAWSNQDRAAALWNARGKEDFEQLMKG